MPDLRSSKAASASPSVGSAAAPAFDLEEVRRRIPLLATSVPLNSCSQAPLMAPTRDAAGRFLDSWDRQGMDWGAWVGEVEAARSEFAALINASPDEVAVTTSLSAAAASVASSLDFSRGRHRILASEAEFPSVAHVWQAFGRYGAEVEWVPMTSGRTGAEAYDSALSGESVLVSACHASYRDGSLQDLAAISRHAHEAGALVFADAYQTVGVEEVDVAALGVDFLATGCVKYLMGTAGIAFLYIRRGVLERLEPAVTGWFGRRDPFSFRQSPLDWSSTARRFDSGTPAIVNAYIARAGMKAIRELGLEAVTGWARELGRQLLLGCRDRGLEVLGGRDSQGKTPLTAIPCARASEVEERLRGRGFLVSARGPAIRLAPHFFNSPQDVDGALDALVEALEKR